MGYHLKKKASFFFRDLPPFLTIAEKSVTLIPTPFRQHYSKKATTNLRNTEWNNNLNKNHDNVQVGATKKILRIWEMHTINI